MTSILSTFLKWNQVTGKIVIFHGELYFPSSSQCINALRSASAGSSNECPFRFLMHIFGNVPSFENALITPVCLSKSYPTVKDRLSFQDSTAPSPGSRVNSFNNGQELTWLLHNIHISCFADSCTFLNLQQNYKFIALRTDVSWTDAGQLITWWVYHHQERCKLNLRHSLYWDLSPII